MPQISVTEYAHLGADNRGNPVPIGLEPAVTRQPVVPFTADTTAGNSAAFDGATSFIRIISDTAGDIAIGPLAVAVVGDTAIAANVAEYFGVHPGDRVSVI